MYLNGYSVRITNGNEVDNGYVKMQHNAQYSVVLKNDHNLRCQARVVIDGKEIGTFRLDAYQNMTLERKPGGDHGKFTFFKEGTAEASQAQVASGNPNNGLVSVAFVPEKRIDYNMKVAYASPITLDSVNYRGSSAGSFTASNFAPGGTGLTGHSNQEFVNVAELDLDHSGTTTINLRLVSDDTNGVRPLYGQSSVIPPYIG